MSRLRLRFAKVGKIRWTSHRDLARMWERAFRRVGLPLAYTAGFSPRPKVSFGLALPTGHESVAEYLDVELVPDAEVDTEALVARLSIALPMGVDVTVIGEIDDRAESLQGQVTSSTWSVTAEVVDGRVGGMAMAESVTDRVAEVLACSELVIIRQRKGVDTTEDIRPLVLSLQIIDLDNTEVGFECELAAQPRNLRPLELLGAIDPGLEERRVRRLYQWIERDGARWEPLRLPGDATDAPRAMQRAS